MEASNPYAPPSAPVSDIPQDSTELAGRGARLGATILDGLIGGLLIYLPFVIYFAASGTANSMIGSDGQFDAKAFLDSGVLLALLPGTVIYAAITIWLVAKNGQTIGKKLVSIKVVRTNGEKAGLGRLFWLRNMVMILISLIPFAGGVVSLIDILLIFRESRKCLHDQIADTIVIRA